MKQQDIITVIDEPTYVADIESFIANWVHDHQDLLKSRGSIVDFNDKKVAVKRIWENLSDPDRPCDHISVNDRVRMVGHLERLFRTQIRNKAQLRELVARFLGGLDGRRLPIPEAIGRARRKLKKTQRQLAELIGLKDHSLISKCESGKKQPTRRILDWLKEAENVTEKGQVKANSRTPRFSVTSSRGKGPSISPNFGKSETSPKQQKCTNADNPTQAAVNPYQEGDTQFIDPGIAGEGAPVPSTPGAEDNITALAKKVSHV